MRTFGTTVMPDYQAMAYLSKNAGYAATNAETDFERQIRAVHLREASSSGYGPDETFHDHLALPDIVVDDVALSNVVISGLRKVYPGFGSATTTIRWNGPDGPEKIDLYSIDNVFVNAHDTETHQDPRPQTAIRAARLMTRYAILGLIQTPKPAEAVVTVE